MHYRTVYRMRQGNNCETSSGESGAMWRTFGSLPPPPPQPQKTYFSIWNAIIMFFPPLLLSLSSVKNSKKINRVTLYQESVLYMHCRLYLYVTQPPGSMWSGLEWLAQAHPSWVHVTCLTMWARGTLASVKGTLTKPLTVHEVVSLTLIPPLLSSILCFPLMHMQPNKIKLSLIGQ